MGRHRKYHTLEEFKEANSKCALERYYRLKGKDADKVMKEIDKLDTLLKYYKDAYPEDDYDIKEKMQNLVYKMIK